MSEGNTLLCMLELESGSDPSPVMRQRVVELVERLRATTVPTVELVDESEDSEQVEKLPGRSDQELKLKNIFFEPMLRPVPPAEGVDDKGKEEEQLEDQPYRTFGVGLEMPPSDPERKRYDSAIAVLDGVRELTMDNEVEFDVEWDGEYIGSIYRGKLDKSLAEGFLNPWREHIEKTPSS
jgi:hypothetical protein